MKRSIAALLSVLILLSFSLPALAAATPQATVSVAALNVRQGPGTGYPVIDVLRSGEAMTLNGRDAAGAWYQVQLADGRAGWISAAYVQVAGDANTLPQVVAAGNQAATGSAGHVIIFQTSSGGPIYAVNPDGTGLRYLTTGMDPVLSPDGRTVAFTRWSSSNNGAPGGLWLINVDGTGERLLMSDVHQPKSPTWSPDGTRLAINMQQGGTIYNQRTCLPFDATHRPRIPRDATDITFENGMVCFVLPANPYWGLRMVSVATGSWTDLPRAEHSFTPAWDPAEPWRIVFHGDHGLMNLDLNQNATSTLTTDVNAHSPVFSPDGTRLAVSYRQNDHWEVHVMRADGTGEVRLTQTPETVLVDEMLAGQTATSWNNAAPAWSPDGQQIAFVTDRSGQWEIWVMNADGSNQHPLVTAAALNGVSIQYYGVDERVISWK